MWVQEYSGSSVVEPEKVFSVLSQPDRWPEWNAGVLRLEMDGPFAAGTHAVMVLPDETALPFTFTWVETNVGFEDLTEVPDAGVAVRVRHELAPNGGGTRITYRCEVDGPDDVAAEVGRMVSSDFAAVIAALAARAEQGDG
jgi:uncharacterized protein YndB with AHSA1/START domain